MPFKERINGYPFYRYIPKGDWDHIDTQGLQPSQYSGRLFITPHFFRFSEEARTLLALPGRNPAQIGIYVDPDYWWTSGLTPVYRPIVPSYGVAGTGWEASIGQTIPRSAVAETFELEGTSNLPGIQWDFTFKSV